MAFGNSGDLFICTLSGEVLHIDTTNSSNGAATAATLAREPGIALAGIQYDDQQHALFVAGTVSGRTFIYFLEPRRPPYRVARREAVPLARPSRWQAPYVNDVVLGPSHALYTDSFEPYIHAVPRFFPAAAQPEAAAAASGGRAGAARFFRLGGEFTSTVGRLNANGLVLARGGELLVSNFDQGYVARAPLPAALSAASGRSGSSGSSGGGSKAGKDGGEEAVMNATIVARLPRLAAGSKGPWPKTWLDTLVMGEGEDVVYVSDNFEDRVLKLQLSPDLSSARVTCVIQPKLPSGRPAIRTPTALAFRGDTLWVLNARLLDCPFVLPCKEQTYEIVGVRPGQVC